MRVVCCVVQCVCVCVCMHVCQCYQPCVYLCVCVCVCVCTHMCVFVSWWERGRGGGLKIQITLALEVMCKMNKNVYILKIVKECRVAKCTHPKYSN